MALTPEVIDNRPEATAFAFGRVWYGGTNSSRWGTTLFYSQVLTDVNRAGKCHQEADPTSETINSLVDSDGGTVKIPDVGKVIKLIALSSSLVIIADNGVWTITGGSEGFAPLSFFVSRVTKIGCVSKRSVIEVEDTVIYANTDGIYQIGAAEESRKVIAAHISEKIDSFYATIPSASLLNSVSLYDSKAQVYSLYYGPVNDLNRSVNLRLKTGAWYPYEFDTDSELLPARFRMAFPFFSQESRTASGVKFLMYSDDDTSQYYSFNEFNDLTFVDFGAADITAYLEFAPLTLDNPQFDKSSTYVTSYFSFTEQSVTGVDGNGAVVYELPSSALLTPRWEWHTSSGGHKLGRQRQVYRFRAPLAAEDGTFDIGATVVTSRDKVRGHGKALSLRYDAETGKDMKLIGVTIPMSMDGQY